MGFDSFATLVLLASILFYIQVQSYQNRRLVKAGLLHPSVIDPAEHPHFKWLEKKAGGRRWAPRLVLIWVGPPLFVLLSPHGIHPR